MTAQTAKLKNGTLVLPPEIQRIWRQTRVLIRVQNDRLVVEKIPTKSKEILKLWEKARGIWKGRKMPDPLKWQDKIRKEWERKLP